MDNVVDNTPVENKILPKKSFKNKKLFVIVGVLILIIASLLVLFKNNLPFVKKQASDISVPLKTEYQNPFDQKAKYENPFSQEEK